MDITGILIICGIVLACANGANDNLKGVATLYGSGTTGFRKALLWATATTLLGSLTAISLAHELLVRFSGKGLVPDALTAAPDFLVAVGLGAGLTVLIASRIGMPISTTHALVGGLVGAGIAASADINGAVLGSAFLGPLLLSPLMSMAATTAIYPLLRCLRARSGIVKEGCFCAGLEPIEIVPALGPTLALERREQLSLSLGTEVSCRERYGGRLFGIPAGAALEAGHYLSAGLVSFARGLNDTPKIAALILAAPALGPGWSVSLCGLAIAVGALIGARRVAETMSVRITAMNAGQGLTANLVTGLLVIGASRLGVPVSTTHVSCGSLFGLGLTTGQARWGLIGKILLAWVTTLPMAAALAWACYRAIV